MSQKLIPTPVSGLNRRGFFVPVVRYDIETAYGLIDALGGMEALADDLGVLPERLNEWAITGHIPTGWHLRLFAKVCALGKTVSPSVFGFGEYDEGAKALTKFMMAAVAAAEGGAHV